MNGKKTPPGRRSEIVRLISRRKQKTRNPYPLLTASSKIRLAPVSSTAKVRTSSTIVGYRECQLNVSHDESYVIREQLTSRAAVIAGALPVGDGTAVWLLCCNNSWGRGRVRRNGASITLSEAGLAAGAAVIAL